MNPVDPVCLGSDEGGATTDDRARQAAFRAVFQKEFDYVWTSLRRLGVDTRDLEDVAQDVFIHVHHRWPEYDAKRPIRPWLFAFAARCASDWRRLARHRVEVMGVSGEPAGVAPRADDALERSRDLALVLSALEEIDLDRRSVFILHELDEYSMKEVTEVLGIPLFTGYSRLRVARQEFTAAVRRLRPEQAGRGET
ncbi:MAG TPA: RNA polymerase sigma factor [Polyangia bacterium]|nr:RNA polymerase sigma factor [Polyangia bacterium]